MKVIHMIVNGTPVELAVREDECLTDTLRQRLGLTSVKKVVGLGSAAHARFFWTERQLIAASI